MKDTLLIKRNREKDRPIVYKIIQYILYGLYSIFIVFSGISLGFLGWFFVIAQTWTGRGAAVIGCILLLFPIHGVVWYWKPTSRNVLRRSGVVLTVIIIILGSSILVLTPTGQSSPNSPIKHCFTTYPQFQRYTLANIIPEIEQLNLGFWLMSYLDPHLTYKQARRVSAITMRIYQEMEKNPHFHQLGSVMNWAYAELLGETFDVGHYYLYIPQKFPKAPLPAIVFLHGSVGNFKAYMWLWAKLAEQYGYIIIAPSFGFGNWASYPQSAQSVLNALKHAQTQVEIDPHHIFLAGLSNGGLGVCEVAKTSPEQFRGLIFLSPVFNNRIVSQPTFQRRWRDRPMLIVTGEKDRRIPLPYIQKHISMFKNAGISVKDIIYSDEDHFLFFSQAPDVLENISRWLQVSQ